MKKTLLVTLALVFALGVGACSAGLANELINGSWEFGDDTGWLRQGGSIENLNTFFGEYGPAPGETDVYGYGMATNWSIGSGSISQSVYVQPELYVVDASGWLRAYDTGGYESWIELQLLIDDVLVDSQRVTASGLDTGWQYVEIRWEGFVLGKKTVRIEGHIDGRQYNPPYTNAWGIVYADGIDLEQSIVPEPASMLALAGGLAGLVIRRRR